MAALAASKPRQAHQTLAAHILRFGSNSRIGARGGPCNPSPLRYLRLRHRRDGGRRLRPCNGLSHNRLSNGRRDLEIILGPGMRLNGHHSVGLGTFRCATGIAALFYMDTGGKNYKMAQAVMEPKRRRGSLASPWSRLRLLRGAFLLHRRPSLFVFGLCPAVGRGLSLIGGASDAFLTCVPPGRPLKQSRDPIKECHTFLCR
jgi:hypothetical protein